VWQSKLYRNEQSTNKFVVNGRRDLDQYLLTFAVMIRKINCLFCVARVEDASRMDNKTCHSLISHADAVQSAESAIQNAIHQYVDGSLFYLFLFI